jgi:hypothetical protein
MHRSNVMPGIQANTRKFGVLRGFEDEYQTNQPGMVIQPPPGYQQRVRQMTMPHPQQQLNPYSTSPTPSDEALKSKMNSDEDEDEESESPLVKMCCFCCNLGVGVLIGAVMFLIFDLIFLIKKSSRFISMSNTPPIRATSFSTPFLEDDGYGDIDSGMQIASLVMTLMSFVSSVVLMICACLCGVPEKNHQIKCVSRYWITQIGLNTVWQIIESIYNSLPDPNSVFVVPLPEIGLPSVGGPTALIVTWTFTVIYLLAYIYMCLILVSFCQMLSSRRHNKIAQYNDRDRVASPQSAVTTASSSAGSAQYPPYQFTQHQFPAGGPLMIRRPDDLASCATMTETLSNGTNSSDDGTVQAHQYRQMLIAQQRAIMMAGQANGVIQRMSPNGSEDIYQEVTQQNELDELYSIRKNGGIDTLPKIPSQMEMGDESQLMNMPVQGMTAQQFAALPPINQMQLLQQHQERQKQFASMGGHGMQLGGPGSLQGIPNQQLGPIPHALLKRRNPSPNQDDGSNISGRSNPNSNGHNVHFAPSCSAPPFGPRPPAYTDTSLQPIVTDGQINFPLRP